MARTRALDVMREGVEKEDRTYALARLPEALGAEAIAVLRDAMGGRPTRDGAGPWRR